MFLNLAIALTLLCWSIWGIFDKKAVESSSSSDVAMTLAILNVMQIPIWIAILSFTQPGWSFSPSTILWSGIASALYVVGLLSYTMALGRAEASMVLGATAAYPLVSVLLAITLLHENVTPFHCFGAILIVLGVFCISKKKNAAASIAQSTPPELALTIVVATLAWGLWGVIDKQGLSTTGVIEFYLAKCIWDIGGAIALWLFYKRKGHQFKISKRTVGLCSASTICLAVGSWAYLSALKISSASYVICICASYPLLMYFLAILFLREQLCRHRLAGVACVAIGGALVQGAQLI